MPTKSVTDIRKEIKALQKDLNTAVKAGIRSSFEELFIKYPNLKSFRWTQYTPHFCDGDPCTFGVNSEIWRDDVEMKDGTDAPDALCDAITEAIEQWEDDELLAAFGDHREVVVTKGSIKAGEYEHD